MAEENVEKVAKGEQAAEKAAARAEKKAQKKSGKDKDKGDSFKTVEQQTPSKVPPRLFVRYKSEIVPALMKEFGYKSVMQVPRLKKITLNMGLGQATANPNLVKEGLVELTQIAGQKAVATKSKKAISNFKLRAGLPIGVMVTLRGKRMWEFLDRLFAVAMPRIRDFKGVSGRAFDGRGSYSMGLREQMVFPEVDYERAEHVKGMNISITTSAKTDKEGKALLTQLGMPFRN